MRDEPDQISESEQGYRSLFASLDQGVCIIEFIDGPLGPLSDYVHLEYNEAYERQAGVKNILGRTVREVFPSEAEKWISFYRGVLQSGKSRRLEIAFDETDRILDVAAHRLEPLTRRQIAVVFRDITARRRAEQALNELNMTLERKVDERTAERDRMWDISPDLMVMLSLDGIYQRINPAWKTVLGYEPEDVVGRFATYFTHPDDVAATEAALETVQAGVLPSYEYRFRHKDGSYRWIQWVAAPGPKEIFAIGRHITAEKEQAEALVRAEAALRQSQKMEAVGQLTGGLAHDFNNLLTGISGSLEMIQMRIAQGRAADVQRYLDGAQGAARRAAALTHRLLAFSRRQTLDPKPTNVARLVTDMEDLISRTVGPSISLETRFSEELWPTLVDQNQLESALLNLCINSRDAMPDGGRILIEVCERHLDIGMEGDNDLPSGDYVALSVSDHGVGMTPDVLDRVFEPFFTTKPIGMGTGLGLSMVFGFAKQSGGHVRIRSEEGAGTAVTLLLPRHGEAEPVDTSPSVADAAHPAQPGRTVLIIDDEPLVRSLIADALEDLGYAVLEAPDGPEGMDILRSDARVDLLITDVGLPNGMNGRQIADAARALRPDLLVLFVTGYADAAVMNHGHLDPRTQVMTKPFEMDAMVDRVRSMIAASHR